MIELGKIHANKHLHVWTKSIDGAEFGNAIYEDDVDAAVAFLGIVKSVCRYAIEPTDINIETVMYSLTQARGMYAGAPGLIVVLSRCDGGCQSPMWN